MNMKYPLRHMLFIAALLSPASAVFAADKPVEKSDKPAEKKAPWRVEATANPAISADGRTMRIELKITNNTEAKQTLEVPRFWECHCDSHRLNFGGWDIELRSARGPFTPANTKTNVALGPGESYKRSWNWVIASEEAKAADFSFRLGLVINGNVGKEPVWTGPISIKPITIKPITAKTTKPQDEAGGKQ
jgi:hypothetical protein